MKRSIININEMNDNFLSCDLSFRGLGKVFHACSPENHPIIFTCDDDYKIAMTIIALCSKLFPGIRIIAFEVMSNHVHFVFSGSEEEFLDFFELFKSFLWRYLKKSGRSISSKEFILKFFPVNDLDYARNLIAYTNRNGAAAIAGETPYSYPWGSNRFYFMQEIKRRHQEQMVPIKLYEIRSITHSRKCDKVLGVYMVDGYASPLCFCDISYGESLFKDPRHYFFKISKHVEVYDEIARMIGESISYTDSELYSIASTLSKQEFGGGDLQALPKDSKIMLAKKLHFEYNAGSKLLQRMLKIPESVLTSLFIS